MFFIGNQQPAPIHCLFQLAQCSGIVFQQGLEGAGFVCQCLQQKHPVMLRDILDRIQRRTNLHERLVRSHVDQVVDIEAKAFDDVGGFTTPRGGKLPQLVADIFQDVAHLFGVQPHFLRAHPPDLQGFRGYPQLLFSHLQLPVVCNQVIGCIHKGIQRQRTGNCRCHTHDQPLQARCQGGAGVVKHPDIRPGFASSPTRLAHPIPGIFCRRTRLLDGGFSPLCRSACTLQRLLRTLQSLIRLFGLFPGLAQTVGNFIHRIRDITRPISAEDNFK